MERLILGYLITIHIYGGNAKHISVFAGIRVSSLNFADCFRSNRWSSCGWGCEWQKVFWKKSRELYKNRKISLDIMSFHTIKNMRLLYCSLGVRLVLLIRDPRGILQSRKHREWCPAKPDCSDPALVCADMVSDFSAAVKLSKKYPRSFRYNITHIVLSIVLMFGISKNLFHARFSNELI